MIPVKIQCTCGQRYAFDIEPFCGRMSYPVACPICGTDGTMAANEVIAFTLQAEVTRRHESRELVMIFAVIGCFGAGMAGIIKACCMTGGIDVLLCLLGAVSAFGLALCVYFWNGRH